MLLVLDAQAADPVHAARSERVLAEGRGFFRLGLGDETATCRATWRGGGAIWLGRDHRLGCRDHRLGCRDRLGDEWLGDGTASEQRRS